MQPNLTESSPFLRRVLATYNSRRPEAFDELLTEDCTLIRDGAEARGREAVKRVLGQLYRAIPDLEYRIDDAVSAGDKMAIRWEGHGTHRGEYHGMAPTGSEMSYGGITFYERRGDLIARIWVSTNLLEQLRKRSEPAHRAESQADAVH
jgi:predicted ester cyclase